MLNATDKKTKESFGQELVINLYGCDLKKISSQDEIKKFVIELCDKVIKMKRFGEPYIPHFGHENPVTSGYSLVQLIETSSITAHFSEYKRSAYINIFSCAYFDPDKTSAFCKQFFKSKNAESLLIVRP